MASKHSAGIVPFRKRDDNVLELFIVHPGGPFWSKKDDGAWSIAKGEYEPDTEDAEATARREFQEEIGIDVPDGELVDLGELKQPSGKRIIGYAVESAFDVAEVRSNTFEMEWPPRSGKTQSFPEVDRAEWFSASRARVKLLKGQRAFVDAVMSLVPDALEESEEGDDTGHETPEQGSLF